MRENSLTIILIMILLCGAIILALWMLAPDNIIPDISSEASNEASSVPVINSSDISNDKSSAESSADESVQMSEPSSDISDESEQTYEERIGVKYAIDITTYLDYIEPEDVEKYEILVNKNTEPLSSDYVPDNLVLSENARRGREDQCYMNATAAKALEALLKEASYYGYGDITVTNAYRSYDTQYYLFYDYYFTIEASKNPGLTKDQIIAIVASYSFPPGQSEHQTGLCCDMHNVSIGSQENFNHTEAAKWLEDNAYRFGFILRYPEGKDDVTGAIYESWHFRFVGRELSTYLYQNNLTLDEYYAKG